MISCVFGLFHPQCPKPTFDLFLTCFWGLGGLFLGGLLLNIPIESYQHVTSLRVPFGCFQV